MPENKQQPNMPLTQKQHKLIENLEAYVALGSVSKDEFLEVMQAVLAKMEAMKKEHDEMMSQHGQEMYNEMQDMMRKVAEAYHELKGMGDESKTTLSEEMKALAQKIEGEIMRVETMIPDPTDLSPIEEKLKASVEELEKKIPSLPEELAPFAIRDKLQSIEENDDKLTIDAIKDLWDELKKLRKLIDGKPNAGVGGGVVGRDLIKDIDISSQLNGSTKTFNIAGVWNIILVNLSSFPYGALRKGVDYTWTQTTITFTSQIDAPTQLASGTSCILTVVSA